MCSFCWAYRPAFLELCTQLLTQYPLLRIVYVAGGLAPDSHTPMPQAMQEKLQSTWRYIQKQIPGTPFNFDFWQRCQPRRSTYPACRAVIAARLLDANQEVEMIYHIQTAYYLRAENPSNDDILIRAATRVGFDATTFTEAYRSEATEHTFQQDLALTRALGISGFPSLVWEASSHNTQHQTLIPVHYTTPQKSLLAIQSLPLQA